MAGNAGRDQAVEPAGVAGEVAAVAFVEAEVGARRQGSRLQQEAEQVVGRPSLGMEAADDAGVAPGRVPGAVRERGDRRSRARGGRPGAGSGSRGRRPGRRNRGSAPAGCRDGGRRRPGRAGSRRSRRRRRPCRGRALRGPRRGHRRFPRSCSRRSAGRAGSRIRRSRCFRGSGPRCRVRQLRASERPVPRAST